MVRAQIWTGRSLAAIGLALLVLTTTARLTLLNAGFDTGAISATDGYERIYTQVLPSPAVQEAIAQGLAGLPVDPTNLTANIRSFLPPRVLKVVTRNLVTNYVNVVLGNSETLNINQALQPVVDNMVHLLQELAPGAIASSPRLKAGSLSGFEDDVRVLLGRLAAGDVELSLPTVSLDPDNVERVASILTIGLQPEQGRELRARISPLLSAGNLSGAFALVVPAYLNEASIRALGDRTDAGVRLVLTVVPRSVETSAPRSVLPLGLGWLTLLGTVLSTACLPTVFSRRGQRAREVAVVLGIAAGLALASGVLIRAVVIDPLRDAGRNPALNPVSRRLVADIDGELRHGVAVTFLELVAIPAVVALVAWVYTRVSRASRAPSRGRRVAVVAAGIGVLVFTGLALPPHDSPIACNGSARLCARPYNVVTYLTSHNSMSSSSRGFLAAGQDPSITGQLDNGVRGLMLDLHYWTTPDQAAPYLAQLDARTRASLAPLLSSFTPRPGVWLCHEFCQVGADSAVAQLRELGKWLDRNPDEVVTVILEDDVTPADVATTMQAAGLSRRLATPPAPGRPWPTLGQMVEDGRTLMIFTQYAKPATGPIRNFYQYAAETPYAASKVADLSCAPGRGQASASLFLINNWVTRTIPDRSSALSVNRSPFLANRVRRCQEQRGMRPNFIAVDFAQVGDPLLVVDALNDQ